MGHQRKPGQMPKAKAHEAEGVGSGPSRDRHRRLRRSHESPTHPCTTECVTEPGLLGRRCNGSLDAWFALRRHHFVMEGPGAAAVRCAPCNTSWGWACRFVPPAVGPQCGKVDRAKPRCGRKRCSVCPFRTAAPMVVCQAVQRPDVQVGQPPRRSRAKLPSLLLGRYPVKARIRFSRGPI